VVAGGDGGSQDFCIQRGRRVYWVQVLFPLGFEPAIIGVTVDSVLRPKVQLGSSQKGSGGFGVVIHLL
jgi:hypothetical protein